jgi:hypothetical protein
MHSMRFAIAGLIYNLALLLETAYPLVFDICNTITALKIYGISLMYPRLWNC